ncbi:conserved Plasmodium protein, unknown function [Plasmodium knowlesi strain H]|uniref:Uncharacterized protein n=1 Tax=Plasmodium knowlesi (strain H) TaxID=5851 RepID=A0A1A7W4E6_PLAKH|nr:conserved Plasmodium protein, unknown function [Plasmodium knowlesi strain H]
MAPFSFIKTSLLIFAYLFLWYQTNYQHQVSALGTLNHDDVSDGSGLYSSDEENINKTHGRLKTAQGVGTNIPHKGYGDYGPPQGGIGSSAHSKQKNNPREGKNLKDKIQKICEKIFCRPAMKHRCILLLIVNILIFCVLFISWVTVDKKTLSAVTAIGLGASAVIILLILLAFLGYHYYKAREKYIEKKKKEKENIIKSKMS